MNRSYLSSLFRKTTGTKFVHYLNSLRIQKACDKNYKMYQIEKNVGYDNVKYFLKVFLKNRRDTRTIPLE